MNIGNKTLDKERQTQTIQSDVVIASKVRLARNLEEFPFCQCIRDDEYDRLKSKLINTLSHLSGSNKFSVLSLENIEPTLLKWLQERNLLEPEYHYYKDNLIILNPEQQAIAKICDGEHLQLYCITEGLSLGEAYSRVEQLDSRLEDKLDYAFSLEWGYHNSSVISMGTGLKASVFLHLPALCLSSLMDEIINAIPRHEIDIQSFYQDEKESFGGIYQVSNYMAFGAGEKEILELLMKTVTTIINQERKSRIELYTGNRLQLQDRIFRAFGILKYARVITLKEAIEHLSFLRLGICCGILDFPALEEINNLFFLIKDINLKNLLNKFDSKAKDDKFINKARTKMIRDVLSHEDESGGRLCLRD